MTTIDETLFNEVGLRDLTATEKTRMLEYVSQTLFANVGLRMANTLDESQLAAFNGFVDRGEDPSDWLEANVNGYEAIVKDELSSIKSKLQENAQNILHAE